MSRKKKWTIPFVSISGVSLHVDILAEGYDGNEVVTLVGAESPFETTEADDPDYFKPVRTQSGYLRIADNGQDADGNAFDWHDLVPTNNMQHQVRLLNESNEVLWIGYMKSETYTAQAFQTVRELAFPIMCPLELLNHIPISFNSSTYGGTFVTIGQALHLVLSSTDVLWEFVDFPYYINDYADLNSRISLLNYCNGNPTVNALSEVATWTDSNSMMKIAESICKFWGWNLRSSGLNLSFGIGDQGLRVIRFSFAQLASIISTSYATFNATQIAAESLSYMSTEHYEERLNGLKSIELIARSGSIANIMEPHLENLSYEWYGGTNHVIPYGDYYSIQFNLHNNTAHTEFLDKYLLTFKPIQFRSGVATHIILARDDHWAKTDTKEDFNLLSDIICRTGGTVPDTILNQRFFSVTSLFSVCAPQGCMISISANARPSLDPRDTYSFNPNRDYIRMFIRIGAKYWNPTNNWWTTNPTAIEVYLDQAAIKTTKKEVSVVGNTVTLLNSYHGGRGYCVELNESLFGKMEVAVLMSPSHEAILDSLVVKIIPNDSLLFPTSKEENSYKTNVNSTFTEERKENLDIASGNNNKYGYGQLFDNDGSYLINVPYFSGISYSNKVPEDVLVTRFKNAYDHSSGRIRIQIHENAQSRNLTTQYTLGGVAYVCQAVSHIWRNDVMELTLREI